MMAAPQITRGLYQWLLMSPQYSRPTTSIRQVCRELAAQHFPQDHSLYAWDELFVPLLRSGVVEFKKNAFRLSPSCVISNSTFSLLINIPPGMLPLSREIREASPGIFVMPGRYDSNRIKTYQFNLRTALLQFSSLTQTISNWTTDHPIEIEGYSYFHDWQFWEKDTDCSKPGFYRKSMEVYGQRVYKMPDQSWRLVPSLKNHPDAYHIAATCSRMHNRLDTGIHYSLDNQRLLVKSPYFPVLIARFLFINTLLNGEEIQEGQHAQYYVPRDAVAALQKIFDHSIAVI